MHSRILNRYLIRECLTTWLATAVVLLAILLSGYFAQFLGRAARGDLPQDLLFQVVTLTSFRYLVVLIPVSLLLAILLSLGRLYNDSEMAAINACGIGLGFLYRPFISIAIVLAIVTSLLSFWISPLSGQRVDYLVTQAKQDVSTGIFEPGQFNRLSDLNGIFYLESADQETGDLQNLFLYARTGGQTSIVTAETGRLLRREGQADTLILNDGYRYDTTPYDAAVRSVKFSEQGVRIPQSDFIYRTWKRALRSTGDLLRDGHPESIAEVQWRISAPLSVLVLTLLAVPLAYTRPRQGRYSKVLVGIVAYITYYNLLGIAKNWVENEEVPMWLGVWWVHILVVCISIWLVLQQQGYRLFPASPDRQEPDEPGPTAKAA